MAPNPYLLAADNAPALISLLRSDSSIASQQDEHGYSLLHAAASYGHISLLQSLVNDFQVDIHLKDEDGETCLFVTETVAVATCLVEELHLDTGIKNNDGQTAMEKIEEEGDFLEVASYLKSHSDRGGMTTSQTADARPIGDRAGPPPLPANMTVDIGTTTVNDEEAGEPDAEFKRRIDELASKEDFQSEERQQELRNLITDAVRGLGSEEREVRRRM